MSIKETVESFIKFRRSIGRKDQSTTYSLRLFAKFMYHPESSYDKDKNQ